MYGNFWVENTIGVTNICFYITVQPQHCSTVLMMDSEEKENCLKTIEKDEMRENKRDRGNNNSSTAQGGSGIKLLYINKFGQERYELIMDFQHVSRKF